MRRTDEPLTVICRMLQRRWDPHPYQITATVLRVALLSAARPSDVYSKFSYVDRVFAEVYTYDCLSNLATGVSNQIVW